MQIRIGVHARPDLLPQDALTEKHVLQSLNPSLQLLDGPSTEPGFGAPLIVDAINAEPNTLRAGLLATAFGLLPATRLAGRDVVFRIRRLLLCGAIRL